MRDLLESELVGNEAGSVEELGDFLTTMVDCYQYQAGNETIEDYDSPTIENLTTSESCPSPVYILFII